MPWEATAEREMDCPLSSLGVAGEIEAVRAGLTENVAANEVTGVGETLLVTVAQKSASAVGAANENRAVVPASPVMGFDPGDTLTTAVSAEQVRWYRCRG